MGTISQLATPFIGASGLGIASRMALSLIANWQQRKNDRERAIASKVSDGNLQWNTDLDPESRHTANLIVTGMFFLFAFVTVTFTIFPQAEFLVYLPETLGEWSFDFLLFSYTRKTDLGDSVLVITSGSIVYQSMIFCTYIISALYKGK